MRKILIKILVPFTIVLIVVIGAVILFGYFDLGPPWGITQKDIDKELGRWWVIYYKMLEDEIPGQTTELIAGKDGVDRILEKEFNIKGIDEHFWEFYEKANLKNEYRFVKRRNELMEEALVKFKGKEALEEIEGKYSLDEVPDLREKVNNAYGE